MARVNYRAIFAAISCWLAASLVSPAHADWGECGVPVCTAPGEQTEVKIVPDGAGGACLAWRDLRSGTNADVYATRIDSEGHTVDGWVAEGNPVCTNPTWQESVQLITDGAGGAIVAWIDSRDGVQAIYAQHILGDGGVAPDWPADGLRVGPMSSQTAFEMDSDGAGGVVFVWIDLRSGARERVYCQRLTGSGSISTGWPAGGLGVSSEYGVWHYWSGASIAADPTGGAYLAWHGYYECSGHGCPPQPNFRFVAHASAGVVQWNQGAAISFCCGSTWPRLVSDGAGGVIYAPNDFLVGYLGIDVAGNTLWTIPKTTYSCNSLVPMVGDGEGGSYSFWTCHSPEGRNAFATRLTGDGNVAPGWVVDGDTISSGPGDQDVHGCAADGFGGAFFGMIDNSSGPLNLYTVHVDASGTPSWPSKGRFVCDQLGEQSFPSIAASEPGSAIVTWEDRRNGPSDIRAQRVSLDYPVAVSMSLVEASAGPSAARLVWQILESSASIGFVQRRTDGEEWREVGQCLADGVGWMRFEDRDVIPGRRYGYRLLVRDGESQVVSEDVWLTIPAEYTLGLDRMRANPVLGDLEVAFALPSGQPAAIELVDLAGRRIVSRSVGALGAGHHVVSLAKKGTLPRGIYFLRLLQGDQSVTSRICLLR